MTEIEQAREKIAFYVKEKHRLESKIVCMVEEIKRLTDKLQEIDILKATVKDIQRLWKVSREGYEREVEARNRAIKERDAIIENKVIEIISLKTKLKKSGFIIPGETIECSSGIRKLDIDD